jgi:7-cyano-7-deazaguanine synthase in queuosine biosynthesis
VTPTRYLVFPSLAASESAVVTPGSRVLLEEVNLFSGRAAFLEHFGSISAIEEDLLTVAGAVFAADRSCQRGEREDLCRHIELTIPVRSPDRLIPERDSIEELLRKLSQDTWELKFSLLTNSQPLVDDEDLIKPSVGGKTLLFSGGLDSLAAAIDFGDAHRSLTLVSHVTRNSVTSNAQKQLVQLMASKGLLFDHRAFFVSSKDGGPTSLEHSVEPSQRTRSFVFLVLGALVARRTGCSELFYMAENGQMAIHLPLTAGRIGAFSTHTAHPEVLSRTQSLLSTLLQYPLTVTNPYLYRTKGEVVGSVATKFNDAIPLSTSCWKNSRVSVKGTSHCGVCVPCLVRTIALQTHGHDATPYARNLLSENVSALPEDDDGRRNLADLCEFALLFSQTSDQELLSEFPELYSQYFDGKKATDMYRRFAHEAKLVLSAYPFVAPLLN